MTNKFRFFRTLLPGGALLLLQVSCGNYSATQLEKSVAAPISIPQVEPKSTTSDRLLANAYRMTASSDEKNSALTDDAGKHEAASQREDDAGSLLSLESMKKITSGNSPEFAAFVKQSFSRVQLDLKDSFTLMDAVALAVQYNRDIKTSYTQYQQSLGNLEIARGAFDLTTQVQWSAAPTYSYYGQDVAPTQTLNTSTYTLGFSNLARFGLQTNATFSYIGQQLSPNYGYSQLGQGNLALTFTMPLLKQFGTTSTDAQERARLLGLEASLAAVIHQINTSLNATIGNYWNYSAAVQNLLLNIEALERSRETLKNTTILVENNLQEPSVLHALAADFSSKESSRQNSEQQLVAARNKLAISLGFPVTNARLLPMPTTEFPGLELEKACRIKGNLPLLLKTALAQRQDYKKAELQMKSSKVIEEKYRRDVLPNVNLVAGVAHTGFTEKSALSRQLETATTGDSAITAGVQVSLPWTNDNAKGQLRNQLGQTEELRFAYKSIQENIASDINNNTNALFYAVGILDAQEVAEQRYRKATEDELKKFQLGVSSILDVISVADRLNTARGNTVSARASLATAITNLRYSTGTLLNDGSQGNKLQLEDLTTPLPPSLLAGLSKTEDCN